jgi:hypothetical protein
MADVVVLTELTGREAGASRRGVRTMKVITIPEQASEIQLLLEQARDEDIVVRTADGTEFMVSAVDDFEHEVVRSRQNAQLMSFLDERAKQTKTVSLEEVKRQLGIVE